MLELIRMGTSIASLYIWLKRFSFDISYMKHSSDLSLGESFAYLPPFISQILDFIYWTVLIFLSILNGVTLKTSNMFALLEIARIYKALKLFADLQGPICYNVGWYPHKITETSHLKNSTTGKITHI